MAIFEVHGKAGAEPGRWCVEHGRVTADRCVRCAVQYRMETEILRRTPVIGYRGYYAVMEGHLEAIRGLRFEKMSDVAKYSERLVGEVDRLLATRRRARA